MNNRSVPGFSLVLLLTALAACAPATWLTWVDDAADVVRAPIMPLSRAGTALASWLRPPKDPSGRPVKDAELGQLRADRDRYEQLWQQQRLRADELAGQLRTLQSLPSSALRGANPPLVVSTEVTGRDPRDARSPIELRVPREGLERLSVGDVVVWNGHVVVGRLADVSSVRAIVLPIANAETPPIEVAVAARPDTPEQPVIRMLLRQQRDGTLSADVDRRRRVEPGQRLVLADPRWPSWAQGLDMAVVDRIDDIDDAPLRRRVIARAAADAPAVSLVTILSADQALTEGHQP